MDYSSLEFTDELQDVLKEMMLDTDYDLLVFLEQYHYYEREQLVEFLDKQLQDDKVVNVESVNRDVQYRQVENKYCVVVSVVDKNTVEIVYDPFSVQNLDLIELETCFNMIKIVPLAVTPVNYKELTNQPLPELVPVQVFKRYLVEALRVNATDIHFDVRHQTGGTVYDVSFRISGDLFPVKLIPITADLNKRIIGSLVAKNTSANKLDLLDSAGVVTSAAGLLGDRVELRISANSALDGYHYVFRLQQHTTVSLGIEQLGFNERVLKVLRRVSKKRSGITLITGAIRTGKNTTAFAMANEMKNKPIKIVSYESPIEVLMPFTQWTTRRILRCY